MITHQTQQQEVVELDMPNQWLHHLGPLLDLLRERERSQCSVEVVLGE
jgi:hypothetical protein